MIWKILGKIYDLLLWIGGEDDDDDAADYPIEDKPKATCYICGNESFEHNPRDELIVCANCRTPK